MKNIDSIIKQVKQGIEQQELLIAKENPATEEGRSNIEYYRCKIAELEYRIRELEAKKKGDTSVIPPEYGDGKYASYSYKEAFDMLRVCYYNYFHQDPSFSPVPKWDMMFYDPTLYLPVHTFLVKGQIPFQIMFRANYPDRKSDNSKSVSIELPFDVLAKEENEEYLRCMLELIKIYAKDDANLVFTNGICTRGTLSFIADRDLSMFSRPETAYYDFFVGLCDNNVRNIIHIGASIQKGVKPEMIEQVQSEIIDLHKRLTASELMSEEELEKSNERIRKRILSMNSHL